MAAVTRYTFTGVLELTGALHIGSGGGGRIGDTTQTDATVVRDSRGRPYIPGSSLRGVLRTAISQLAPQLGLGTIREDDEIEKTQRRIDDEEERRRRGGQSALGEAELQDLLDGALSPGERLFGTVFWASPLLIPDLHLLDQKELAGEVRHGVGIDRDTGAAREAIKYDFEVLPRGARFAFFMRCDVPHFPTSFQQDWSRMLALGLRLLEQGELTIGGRVARGVGQVWLHDLATYTLDTSNRNSLLDALLADDELARYGTRFVGDWTIDILREIR
ncbi:MAG: hypothetical protein IPO81_00595 [Kouleothrix sp.]|nr:hypothetical protein [Kouleothrix sp.]